MFEYNDMLLTDLKKELDNYDRVFLIPGSDRAYSDLFIKFSGSEELEKYKKKILILSVSELAGGNNYSYRKISFDEEAQLEKLYFMYEFSDRFRLLSQEESFGGILNFVDMGILTEEEAFYALLY